MEFKCHFCPRRFIFHYAFYQHLHIEHRKYICEICQVEFPSRKTYKQHSNVHLKLEYDLCDDRWDAEVELEKKIEKEIWVKSMITDSAQEILLIQNALKDILTVIRGGVGGNINEETSPLFIKIMDLIPRLEYESDYLTYFTNIAGTLSKFDEGIKINIPPKYRPGLPERAEWK